MSKSIDIKQLPKGYPVQIEFPAEGTPENGILPHRHDYYEIIWAMEGKGSHSIDFVEYLLTPDLIYMVTPGQVHEAKKFPKKSCFITFNSGFLEGSYRHKIIIDQLFYQFNGRSPCLKIDQENARDLHALIHILHKEFFRTNTDWRLIEPLLSSIIHYLARFQPASLKPDAIIEERVIQLYQLIDTHFRQTKKADYYSNKLSLSNKRTNELMRKHAGKTVTRVIHERTTLEAHRELAFTTKTIKQIAHDLGYDDVSYFCRFFRKMSGESPKEFRDRTFK